MAQNYYKFKNLYIAILLCLPLTTSCLLIVFHTQAVSANERDIIVVQSQKIKPYNEVVTGFVEKCAEKGFSIKDVYTLHGNLDAGKNVSYNFKANNPNPDLVLAVGVLAATFVKELYQVTPLIFTMVINYDQFNLTGNNITGITMDVPIEDQFTVINTFLGKNKNVGVIYDPIKTGNLISKALRVSENFGLNIFRSEITLEKEIKPKLNNIIKKIDALWLMPDSSIASDKSRDYIIKMALEKHLLTFCTSNSLVKSGALVSVLPDYKSIGFQAAALALTLLGDTSITSLGIKQPGIFKLLINRQTAGKMGIDLLSIQSRYKTVFYISGTEIID